MTKHRTHTTQDSETLRIYIDNLPHCIIKKKEFSGFCSYKQNGVYYIEIWKKKNKELLEHEEREVWEEILKQLDKIL